jgi:hypothetical protein
MIYQDELIRLDTEWRTLMVSGREYSGALGDDGVGRKRGEISAYKEKVMRSCICPEDKERILRDIAENSRYLIAAGDSKPLERGDQIMGIDSKMMQGILIGGLGGFFGMYALDRIGEHLAMGAKEGVMEGLSQVVKG